MLVIVDLFSSPWAGSTDTLTISILPMPRKPTDGGAPSNFAKSLESTQRVEVYSTVTSVTCHYPGAHYSERLGEPSIFYYSLSERAPDKAPIRPSAASTARFLSARSGAVKLSFLCTLSDSFLCVSFSSASSMLYVLTADSL